MVEHCTSRAIALRDIPPIFVFAKDAFAAEIEVALDGGLVFLVLCLQDGEVLLEKPGAGSAAEVLWVKSNGEAGVRNAG